MLRLNRFVYLSPSSLGDAVHMLQLHGPEALLMAGGTDVLVNIKHRVCTPGYVVGIRRLPELQTLSTDGSGWLTIGAGTTLRQIETDPTIGSRYPALAHAAALISAPQVRTIATLGGNVCLDVRCNYYNQSHDWRKGIGFCMKRDSAICRVAPGGDRCWAVASADTVPVLVAMGAEVSVLGREGVRRMAIERLYQDDGLMPLTLSQEEIVTAVHIPPQNGRACVYQKFRLRQSFDFPLVGVAVSLGRENKSCKDVRIVLTAVASFPERAERAESILTGATLDEDTISAAGQAIFREAKPMDNTAGTIFHRKRMARVLTERALRELAAAE